MVSYGTDPSGTDPSPVSVGFLALSLCQHHNW